MKKLISLFFIVVFLTGCSATVPSGSQTNVQDLSSKVCGWGYRRTDDRPEFTEEQISLMEKYNCIYMGDKNDKSLYLTFDEGYENGYTSIILDVLRQKGVPAAFFVTAAYVKNEPELVMRMAKEGHIVGNHTANHPCVPTLSEKEIETELNELDRLVYGVIKKNCKYFRAPKGEYSEKSLAVTSQLGYTNTFWSFAYVDWDDKVSTDIAKQKIVENLHSGSVLLLHATSRANAECLADVIDIARKEGYVFKSLDEYKNKYLKT